MATGALDANGIWQYGEDDSETTFSGLLNKLGGSTSTTVTRLEELSGLTAAQLTTHRDNLAVGLVNIAPTTIEKAGTGSTASATPLGLITFGACTSLSINGIFSTTYSKYLFYLSGAGGTGTADLLFRFRTSGLVDASTSYYQQQIQIAGGSLTGIDNSNITQGHIGVVGSGGNSASSAFVLHNPATAIATNYSGQVYAIPSSQLAKNISGVHSTAAAYTGITIYTSSGSMSGTIQIFGMND